MRRTALACTLACLVLPASASAAITTTNDPVALAGAIANGSAPGAVTGASFELAPAPTNASSGIGDSALAGFPIAGSTYGILTTGNAALADDAPQSGFASALGGTQPTNRGPNAEDVTVLRINLNVPAQANCLTVGFRFLSEEFPEFVGTQFNDAFIAEMDTSDWITLSDSTITAPRNFAYDDADNVISINTSSMAATEAAGTIYDGATPQLSAASPVTPGAHTLFLSIFDQGSGYDSAVFIDRLGFLATAPGGCVRGAQADETAPVVSVSAPANGSSTEDSTPTISGTAGTAQGDSSEVVVNVYAGGSASGAPVQTLRTTRSGGAWSVDAGGLALGQYTARAEQADSGGNTGVSNASTFSVVPPAPLQQVEAAASQSPTPVLGETVVAGAVSGTVRIKLKNGKFRTLGANESIPLGSTVDATKGKVRVTAAAGAGGAVQTADFYKGAFVITQTGGSKKPITQLALSGKLSCRKTTAKKKASTSAGKKVRRLWGDGKGRFRTKGKHGAATVRGTKWLTEDFCDSTKITVKQGTVVVRDFARKKNKVVKQGQSYVARAKAKRKKNN
jgi:hypothetical protein